MPCHDIPEWNARRHAGFVFGFASMDQLQNWFNAEERETLSGVGFSVVALEGDASQVLIGGHQVAFIADAAERLSTQSLCGIAGGS